MNPCLVVDDTYSRKFYFDFPSDANLNDDKIARQVAVSGFIGVTNWQRIEGSGDIRLYATFARPVTQDAWQRLNDAMNAAFAYSQELRRNEREKT